MLTDGSGRPLTWPDGPPVTPQDLDAFKRYWASQNKYRDTLTAEDTRRFGVTSGQTATAEADRVAQAKAALKEQRRQYDLTFGLDQQRFGLDTQKFQEGQRQFGVNTGLDLLKTGATMRGPLDAFQGEAYARGIQTNGLAPYLATLQGGGTPSYGGGTATTANPTPLTVGTLANTLSGGTAAPGAAAGTTNTATTDAYGRPTLSAPYQANLDAINTVAQKGLANLPQGAWENLSDAEKKSYISGSDYLGRDTGSELQYWQRSRPGQGSAVGA